MSVFRAGLTPLIVMCVLSNSAGAQPANQWPVDATLTYLFCEKGECDVSHPVVQGTISFGTRTSLKRIFNTTQVTFGPFHLTRATDVTGATIAPDSTFRV